MYVLSLKKKSNELDFHARDVSHKCELPHFTFINMF